MSSKKVETAVFGLGGTTKNVEELYREIYDLRQEEDKLYTEIFKLREAALKGNNEAYYGVRGKKLVKALTEMGARTANRVSKFRTAYDKEAKAHVKQVEEDQNTNFLKAGDIRNSNRKLPEGSMDDDENVAATVAMVRTLLNMN